MTSHHVRDETSAGNIERTGPRPRRTGRQGRRYIYRMAGSIVHGLWKLWWLTTAALLIVGMISRYELVRSEHLGPLAVGSEVAAGDDGAASLIADELDALPVIRYAGLDVALLNARSIPVNNSGKPIVVADLAVRNSTDAQVRLTSQQISLIHVDGTVAAMDRFEYAEHANRLVLDPGDTQQALAVFKLRGKLDELGAYSLQIGEQGRWPEHLPLDGQVAPAVYPQPLEILSQEDGPVRLGDLAVEMTDASTALEYGVYRAPVGRHLAVISVSVSGAPGALDRGGFDQGLWTLTDGHGPRRALRAEIGERSLDGNTVTLKLVFAYGTEASELELFIGDGQPKDAQSVARFAVQAFE